MACDRWGIGGQCLWQSTFGLVGNRIRAHRSAVSQHAAVEADVVLRQASNFEKITI